MKADLIILLLGTTVMFLVVVLLILFAYRYQKKLNVKRSQNRELEELLRSEELKSAYALLAGQDQERERIAQDLHDRLGAQLSTIQIYLDLMSQTQLSVNQERHMAQLHLATDTSIKEVRAIAHDLSVSALSLFGLPTAIEQLCQVVNDSKKIEASVHIALHEEIPRAIALDLYHIIQELITNTLKYAHASKIRIDVAAIENEINVIYQDDGIGFDPKQKKVGMGLHGIRLRTEKHQGLLTLETQKGLGCSFIMEIPLNVS